MSSTAIVTVVKMMESLPEAAQDRVAEHLREYLADLEDEVCWDDLFSRTQTRLVGAARRAKAEIARGAPGRWMPMRYEVRNAAFIST